MNYLLKENETAIDFAKRLQGELNDYKEKIKSIKDKETLDEEEKKCQEALSEYEEYVKGVSYELAKDVTYDGTKFKKGEICDRIVYHLNKLEVKWDYTIGLYGLSKLWKSKPDTLTFGELDSTLRSLDQVMFKGFKEWQDILAINEYFKANHEEFSIDTATHIYLAQRHNAVLEQIELTKVPDNE